MRGRSVRPPLNAIVGAPSVDSLTLDVRIDTLLITTKAHTHTALEKPQRASLHTLIHSITVIRHPLL